MKVRVMYAVAHKLSPISGNAQHHGAAAILWIIVQEIDQFLKLYVPYVVGTVRKTDSPDYHERLPVMVEVPVGRGVIGDLHAVHKELPVIDKKSAVLTPGGVKPREVVHHGDGPPVLFAVFLCVTKDSHGVVSGTVPGAAAAVKPLQEDAVEPVFLHPPEMCLDGLLVIGAEEPGSGPVRVFQTRGVGILVFTHVGPHVDVDPVLVGIHDSLPVIVEPALVSRHHETMIRGIG